VRQKRAAGGRSGERCVRSGPVAAVLAGGVWEAGLPQAGGVWEAGLPQAGGVWEAGLPQASGA
jgi:hypothetical protein